MRGEELVDWLLSGDAAVQYQTHRDLLHVRRDDLRSRISTEGWGSRFLGARQNDHWGKGFYQPKWISTHYTVLDLKNLGLIPSHAGVRQAVVRALAAHRGSDGGIYPIGASRSSDVCVNGMFLNYASYFGVDERDLASIVDFLLAQHMADGGFNCDSNTSRGALHSSLHSTVSVLEGILEYTASDNSYRVPELERAASGGREFMLRHELFRSDRTGRVIDDRMLRLSYPARWRYDILRALDYLRGAGVEYDPRMADALGILKRKRRADGRWPLQAKHPGQVHFDMEKGGEPSRWNTLRALRVLDHFESE
ncbi:MAG: hypothetical protein ACE5E0_04505 [Terriglobia bacterium]